MTITERAVVVGVFRDRNDADRAVQELQRASFRDDQIGFAMRDEPGAEDTLASAESAAGESAATGMLTGGLFGGLIGAAASGLLPGIGPVIAGGILASVLGGVAIGAAAGGVLGALIGIGIPEEEARYYESELHAGKTLVTVKTEGRYGDAASILRRFGAQEIETTARGANSGAPPII